MKQSAIILALAIAIPAFAQTPKPAVPAPAAKPKAVPAVPVEIREKFFKASSEAKDAQLRLQQAQQDAQQKAVTYQAQIKAAQDACGADYNVNLDQAGELVCQEKPKAVEPAKK